MRTDTDNLPLKAKTVPLILIKKDLSIITAQNTIEKKSLIGKYEEGDILLSVWPGQWYSDVFVVTKENAIKLLG